MKVGDFLSKEFFITNVNESVSKVISSLKKTGFLGGIVINDEREYMGVIHVREVIRVKSDPGKIRVLNILKRAPILGEDYSLFKAVELMLRVDARVLAVGSNEQINGVLYDIDAIKAFLNNEFMRSHVSKIMTRNIITVDKTVSIAKAIKTLVENKVSHLPVLKDGKLVGIVSTHDIAAKVLFPRAKTTLGERVGERVKNLSLPISNLMSYPVLTVRKEASISECVRIMIDRGVGSLIIMDNRSVSEIITRKDILEYILASERKHVKTYYQIIGETTRLTEREERLMERIIKSFLWKVERRYGGGNLFLHVKRVKGMRRPVTTVKVRLLTNSGTYHASHHGYNFLECLQILFRILERSIVVKTDLVRRRKRLENKITKYFPKLFE